MTMLSTPDSVVLFAVCLLVLALRRPRVLAVCPAAAGAAMFGVMLYGITHAAVLANEGQQILAQLR